MGQWLSNVEIYIRAETEEETIGIMADILTYAEKVAGVDLVVYDNGGFIEDYDDDPRCVCGVHRSEHLLCGCGEWQRS